MRYIADSSGYLQEASFGADISCDGLDCTEYTGTVPSGYDSLEDWYIQECEKLYRWKIISGNLTMDGSIIAPEEKAVIDHVVEQGEKSGWTYRIWASGVQECWINSTWEAFDLSESKQYSGMYAVTFTLAFPLAFASPPAVLVDGGSTEYVNFLRLAKPYTDKITVWLLSMSDRTDPVDVNYHVYAKGKTITQTDAFLGSNALGLMRLGKGG